MLLHSVSAPSAGLCGCCFCFPLTEEYIRPYLCSICWQIKQGKINNCNHRETHWSDPDHGSLRRNWMGQPEQSCGCRVERKWGVWCSAVWRGFLGSMPDRRQGGWVDSLAQATFPKGIYWLALITRSQQCAILIWDKVKEMWGYSCQSPDQSVTNNESQTGVLVPDVQVTSGYMERL